jgi:2-polyprenyl-6-methoxyphenol hydroxylase-like FAD-dependent oxidoreductase
MSCLREFTPEGLLIREVDLVEPNKRWQHPWHLVQRMALHNKLKSLATSPDGPGHPARLHTSSRVLRVDPAEGIIELEDGRVVAADVVVGADGVYVSANNLNEPNLRSNYAQSSVRKYVSSSDPPRLFSSGKAAYRFVIRRSVAESEAETKALVERPNTLQMWFGTDRRVIMYPCNNSQDFNFVFIHPDNESHATRDHCTKPQLFDWYVVGLTATPSGWNKAGSIEQCLEVFQGFDPALKRLIAKIDTPILVWQLLDMEPLESWTAGKLGLLGDAAHPFTPRTSSRRCSAPALLQTP